MLLGGQPLATSKVGEISSGFSRLPVVPRMSAMSDTLRSVVDSRVRKPRPRTLRRANQADSISILGIEMPFPCSACQYASRSCRISETSADCAECVRRGSKDCDVGLSMA